MSDIEDEYSDEEVMDPADREREFTLRQFGIHAALPVAEGEIDFDAGEELCGGERGCGSGLPQIWHQAFHACMHASSMQARPRTRRITSCGLGRRRPCAPRSCGSRSAQRS